MRTTHRLVGYALAAGLLAMATGCTATVATRRTRTTQMGNYRSEGQRRGYANGYSEGIEKGRSDGRDGDRLDAARHKEYRDGWKMI